MRGQEGNAPGWLGTPPRWASSAKTGVGTALTSESPVWFTTGHGILNEIYYPRIDTAGTRDLGLIVTDGEDFFSEEKGTRHTGSSMFWRPPLFRLINTCLKGRNRIEKEIVTDPGRDVPAQFRHETVDDQEKHLFLIRSEFQIHCSLSFSISVLNQCKCRSLPKADPQHRTGLSPDASRI